MKQLHSTPNTLGLVTFIKETHAKHVQINSSRRYRKHLPNHHFIENILQIHHEHRNQWLKFIAHRSIAWWIAINFMIGSFLFVLGSFIANHTSQVASFFTQGNNLTWIFFIGSIFFTLAAGLQLLEAINGDISDINRQKTQWRWWVWKPHNAGYIASLVQFLGTLLFNMNTGVGFISDMNTTQLEIYNWSPNVIGCIFFLIASYIAMIEVTHKLWSFQPRLISWWIVVLNMLGSVAFAVSAIYSWLEITSHDTWWSWGVNGFTLLGGVCFFLASYLLIPELFDAGKKEDAAYLNKITNETVPHAS